MSYFEKLISFTQHLEDPDYPLLGPIRRGLCLFGLWNTGSKFRIITFNMIHASTFLFVISLFVDLYKVRHDINMTLNNMSLTVLSVICVFKCMSYVLNREKWKELTESVSKFELQQIRTKDKIIKKYMKEYITYARIITNMFWMLVFITNALLIISPFLKYFSKSYREGLKAGTEPLPQIMYSWLPFDNNKMPGYFAGIVIHIFMGCQGSGVLAVYDMNAIAVMSYLKGQMIILREKCREIFDGDGISTKEILRRIRECHKAHNTLIKHYRMLNTLLSPTMFLYVLLCSITICTGVVQFTSKNVTTSQKLWVLQYTSALIMQLFIYCWHGNEVAVETRLVDRGVYESNWWKGDKITKKQIHLLAAKLDYTMMLDAGPYTQLTIPTFIDVMKGSYSFYTLFSQMQDNK